MKIRVPLVFAMATGMTTLPALSQAATNPPPLDLLNKLQSEAYETSSHTSELQSLARSSGVSWEADAEALDTLKADINSMGQTLLRLQEMRDAATPEERQACDSALPLLKLMVSNTNAAIQFVNHNHGRFWKPAYQEDVTNIADEASRLKNEVGLYTKLANVREREKRIETHLGSEAGS
jgi:hypothetical protein